MSRIGKIGRGLFGIAVLGALAFGATAALPAPAEAVSRTHWCTECRDNCLASGASGWSCNAMDVSCDCVW